LNLTFAQKEKIKEEDFYINCLEYKKLADDTKRLFGLSGLSYQNSLENINEDEVLENLCKISMRIIFLGI
jgi:hypothetical protein